MARGADDRRYAGRDLSPQPRHLVFARSIPTCSTTSSPRRPRCRRDPWAHKADIPRILNWRDPAQAPFGVRRPINTSEPQWDAAVFCLRHFLDGGWAPIPSNPAEGSTNFSRCRERGGASMNAASVCSSMKPGRRGDHPGQSPSSWCGAPGCVSMAPRWSR